MADRAARRARLNADLDELRARLVAARADVRALPKTGRTAAQRSAAKTARFELLVGRIVLNLAGVALDDDLDDTNAS